MGLLGGLVRADAAWLVSLWAAAEALTMHNRPHDHPQDGPQESAPRSDDGCATPARALAKGSRRFRLSAPVGPGRDAAETLTAADAW